MSEPEKDEHGCVCTGDMGVIPPEDRFEEHDDDDNTGSNDNASDK